jgi:hypothetical protein
MCIPGVEWRSAQGSCVSAGLAETGAAFFGWSVKIDWVRPGSEMPRVPDVPVPWRDKQRYRNSIAPITAWYLGAYLSLLANRQADVCTSMASGRPRSQSGLSQSIEPSKIRTGCMPRPLLTARWTILIDFLPSFGGVCGHRREAQCSHPTTLRLHSQILSQSGLRMTQFLQHPVLGTAACRATSLRVLLSRLTADTNAEIQR